MTEFYEIGDDELLYRKISVKSEWYDPARQEVKPDAFKLRDSDRDGISIDRARSEQHSDFRSIEEAAQGQSVKGYYVAVLRVNVLRKYGFTVTSAPLQSNPGHALIKDLNYGNRLDPSSQEKLALLAHKLVDRVEGPFLFES